MDERAARTRRRRSASLACLVAAVSFCAFLPALHAGFVNFDDQLLFTGNPYYRGFGARKLQWMFTARAVGHYMPITWLTSAFDFEISGLDPSSYHRTNLVLHALNAALFFFVARRVIGAALRLDVPEIGDARARSLDLASAAAALAFAVHPLRVESVAWCTERRDVLSVFFLLGSLLAYLRAFPRETHRAQSRVAFSTSLALFALSLLSKAMGMTLPLVLVALDVYPLRRLPASPRRWLARELRPVWVQKLPFAALSLASGTIALWALRNAPTSESWGALPRAAQVFYQLAFYARKTLWPSGLAALYELPYRFDALEPRFVASAITVAFAGVAAFVFRRKAPGVAIALVVYAIVLAPVLGVTRSGPQLAADRYSHLSCMPFAILFGAALDSAWSSSLGRGRKVACAALALAVVGALFAATWKQTTTWRDSRALWTHALRVGAESAMAHASLASLDAEEGDIQSALDHLHRALEIRPDQGTAWYSLARVEQALGRKKDAEHAYTEAAAHYVPAYLSLVKLGDLCLDDPQRLDEAVAHYRAAVADMEARDAEWQTPSVYLHLARALAKRGDAEGAARAEAAAASVKGPRPR
jgi:tetratricopeptide (TPR) repeat protein